MKKDFSLYEKLGIQITEASVNIDRDMVMMQCYFGVIIVLFFII